MAAQFIEGYRIEAELASTQGVRLFAARQLRQDAPVLLQVWDAAAPADRAAVRELAGRRHPGLAVVLDIGDTAQGQLYVALGGLPGPSLAKQLLDGMDLEQACATLRRLAVVYQHLQSHGDWLPNLDPELVFQDSHGRPVLTRLQAATPEAHQHHGLGQLGRLFFEALTGYAPSADNLRLPDYLQRWQDLVDACLGPAPVSSAAELLGRLDALEGRQPAAAPVAPRDPAESIEPRSPGKPSSQQTAAARSEASTDPSLKVDRRPTAPVAPPPQPGPARPDPAKPDPAKPGAPVAADSVDPLRTTAPSRRLDAAEPVRPQASPQAPAQAARRRPALPELELPPRPSRLPLVAALGLGVPALIALIWWALAAQAPAPASLALEAERERTPQAVATPAPAAPPAAAVTPPLPESEFVAPDPAEDWFPDDSTEVDVNALPTVEDPVARFILFGNANLQAGRLIEPPQRNALERFLLALRIEPGNREAQAGIGKLAERCLAQLESGTAIDDQLKALSCVNTVAAAHEAGSPAAQQAIEWRSRAIQQRIQAGQQALRSWNREDALRQFSEAQRFEPGNPAAKAGVEEASQLGRPGYRFSDLLRSGGQGPQLLVHGGLAWGRFETRVDDYRRYWNLSGEARFGSEPPSCRDRESIFRGSKRRSWQAPDLPQDGSHPVVCVNFAMAEHYAEWLSAETGHRYRLPTRAEWLAVAGAPPAQCAANWRDQSAARQWDARDALACEDGHPFTAPVAAAAGAPAAASGLIGLWGNVGEWLADCAGSNCRERLAAGGSWFVRLDEVQPRGFAAEPGFTTIGLRVVRELPAHE